MHHHLIPLTLCLTAASHPLPHSSSGLEQGMQQACRIQFGFVIYQTLTPEQDSGRIPEIDGRGQAGSFWRQECGSSVVGAVEGEKASVAWGWAGWGRGRDSDSVRGPAPTHLWLPSFLPTASSSLGDSAIQVW